jgi:hypothetical protein
MNDCGDPGFFASVGAVSTSEEEILSIPSFNGRHFPDLPADLILANEAAFIEESLPVVRPLAVDVMLAGLPWAGSREKNVVGVGDESVDQGACGCGLKVFCDFEAKNQIKAPMSNPRLGEVCEANEIGRYVELGSGNMNPVNSPDVLNAILEGGSQPGASAAADIEKGSGGD